MCRGPPGVGRKGGGGEEGRAAGADRKVVWAKGWGGQKEGWWAEGALGRGRGALSRGGWVAEELWAEGAGGQRRLVGRGSQLPN